MYNLKGKQVSELEKVTFSDLGMYESDIEEILRNNIEMVCDVEESLLIIGQQVRNEKYGRSDLTAIDNNGALVLIEIKRDKEDIVNRRESFEFQAIRYAASYATVESIDELVNLVYAPYIEKYKEEFSLGDLTTHELGLRKINEFLEENNATDKFNKEQRIILVASDFDEQTLSAVAWLNKNSVDMTTFKLIPYKINDDIYLKTEKLLPIGTYNDFYVNLLNKNRPTNINTKSAIRRSLPRIDEMLDWGVVNAGDVVQAKNRDNEAILLDNGNVSVDGEEKSLQQWLKSIFGWSSVQTYRFTMHKETNRSLGDIRREYMKSIEKEI